MRITEKDLQALVRELNQETGNPTEAMITQDNGRSVFQVGCYVLDHAYGGVSVHQVVSLGGAERDLFHCGHVPKRKLYDLLVSLIMGYRMGRAGIVKRYRATVEQGAAVENYTIESESDFLAKIKAHRLFDADHPNRDDAEITGFQLVGGGL